MRSVFFLYVFIVSTVLTTSTYSQINISGSGESLETQENNDEKDKLRKWIAEFANIKMLDHSLQTRRASKSNELKQLYKEFYKYDDKDTADYKFPIEVFLCSKLELDQLWAKWLTGKYKYTPEGKEAVTTTIGIYVVELCYLVDTIRGGKYQITPQIKLNSLLAEKAGEDTAGIDEAELGIRVKEFFLDTYESPNKAPFHEATKFLFSYLKEKSKTIINGLIRSTKSLKALYEEEDIRRLANELDELIIRNRSDSGDYILDKGGANFNTGYRFHFNEQLREINKQTFDDYYVVSVTTPYVLNKTELWEFGKRVISQVKEKKPDEISLTIIHTFQDKGNSGNQLKFTTGESSEHKGLFAKFRKSSPVISDQNVYLDIQKTISGIYNQLDIRNRDVLCKATDLVTKLSAASEFVTVSEYEQRNPTTFTLNRNDVKATVEPVNANHYTYSGIPINGINGYVLDGHGGSKQVNRITKGEVSYQAVFGYYSQIQTFGDNVDDAIQGYVFLGFFPQSWVSHLQSNSGKGFVHLSDLKGLGKYAKEGVHYEVCKSGDEVHAVFMNGPDCQLELADYKLSKIPELTGEGSLRLMGVKTIMFKPEDAGTDNYQLITSKELSKDDAVCRVKKIIANNSYGKKFLSRFYNPGYGEDQKSVVEVAEFFDEHGIHARQLQGISAEQATFVEELYDITFQVHSDRFYTDVVEGNDFNSFLIYLEERTNTFENIISLARSENDEDMISDIVNEFLGHEDLKLRLTYKERLKFLNLMADDMVGDEEEAAVKLVESINEHELKNFLDGLNELDENGNSLLQKLDEGLSDFWSNGGYSRFVHAITAYAIEVYLTPEAVKELEKDLYSEFRLIRFYEYKEEDVGYFVHRYDAEWAEISGEHRINLDYNFEFQLFKGFTGELLTYSTSASGIAGQINEAHGDNSTKVLDPLRDFVFVFDPTITSELRAKEVPPVFPAYYVKYLVSNKSRDRAWYATSLVVDALTVAVSVATLGTASPLIVAIETIGIVSAVTNASVTLLLDIEELDPELAEHIRNVTLAMDIASIGIALPTLLKNAPEALKTAAQELTNFQNYAKFPAHIGNKLRELQDNVRLLYQKSGVRLGDVIEGGVTSLSRAWKNGWDKQKVIDVPKGSRPDPSVYLDESYISNHLSKFNSEGGAFVIVKSWIEMGNYSQFPVKKFAMLRSEMEEVISNFRNSRSTEVLEEALGYSRGDLSGLENELFVFYVDKGKYKFDFPDGNEIGANSLWEPGGKTSGGFHEATVISLGDPSVPITHNKSIEFLKKNFTWTKLKQ